MQIQPRLLRLRDAPSYLGMDRNRFNREVRPALTELRIGRQGVALYRHRRRRGGSLPHGHCLRHRATRGVGIVCGAEAAPCHQ